MTAFPDAKEAVIIYIRQYNFDVPDKDSFLGWTRPQFMAKDIACNLIERRFEGDPMTAAAVSCYIAQKSFEEVDGCWSEGTGLRNFSKDWRCRYYTISSYTGEAIEAIEQVTGESVDREDVFGYDTRKEE